MPNFAHTCFLLLLCCSVVWCDRQVFKLDFDWKFVLGDVTGQDLCPAASAFPISLVGQICDNWAHQAAYNLQEFECMLYCCGEPSCAGWLFRPSDGWCAIGNDFSSCRPDPDKAFTAGGGRHVPAPIVQPPADGPQSVGFNDSAWTTVSVPHDFVVQQQPASDQEWSHGYRARNVSWYRKSFMVDASMQSRVLWLEFDGVYRSSDFWLNGQYLGHHSSGYTSFRFRIDNVSSLVIGSENLLAVRVDPRANEGWWYEGGGIYRHVWLTSASYLHVAPWGVYAPSTVVGPIGEGQVADATMNVYTEVELSREAPAGLSYQLQSELFLDDDTLFWGDTLAPLSIAPGASQSIGQFATLPQTSLWRTYSGPGNGVGWMRLQTTLFVDNVVVDSVNTTVGVRSLVFDPDLGFFLNNVSLKVNGMCNHQDFAGVGVAVPDRVSRFRVETQLDLHINAWRMSHNPPNPELLEWTDRLGMMVWDENRLFGNFSQWFVDMRDMLLRDRNHPSIIWWSLCNEWGCQQLDMNTTLAVGVQFRQLVKQLDLSRPISGAWNGDIDAASQWSALVTDIMGLNYNTQGYDPFHAANPKTPFISSESCSCTSDRLFAANDTQQLIGAAHSWPCIRDCWAPVANRSFVMGSFDWTAFDYRGEETPTVWPSVNSHFGILDLAGYSKDDAFYSKAWFVPDSPLVHIVPHSWDSAPLADPVAVLGDCADADAEWVFSSSSSSSSSSLGVRASLQLRMVNSTVRSAVRVSECLHYDGGGNYPTTLASCNTADATFLFSYDPTTSHIFYQAAAGQFCLDVEGGTGPNVGFFACKTGGGDDSNQRFTLADGGRIVSAVGSGNLCVRLRPAQILVYTNGDSVELFLNGQSLGSQAVPQWEIAAFSNVTFATGNLTAVATRNNSAWASQTLVTPGPALALALAVDRPLPGDSLIADRQDTALLTARVVDAAGNLVHSVSPVVTFSVSGPGVIIGTGSGNPSDHLPDGGPVRQLWDGKARVLVQATSDPGKITVTVSCNDGSLKPAAADLITVAPSSPWPTL